MSGWQDIATCDWVEIEILVCDVADGKPGTIALAHQSGGRWWLGHPASGWDESLDFTPEYWIRREVAENPFHLPLPDAPAPPPTAITGAGE